MDLGLFLPYAEGALTREETLELVRAAEANGWHSVWVPEAWSFDAFMILATLADATDRIGLATGIVNVYSRTPALIGQSIATLDALSGGRAILGLGTSGPQVIEGWHGMAFDKPLRRTRETIDIVRTILRRDPLAYEGEVFRLTKGLRLINHPVRTAVPIAVASLGPRNIEMTAELADVWLPTIYSARRAGEVFGPSLEAGRARRSPDLGPLTVMPTVSVAITDDPEPARAFSRLGLALYIGGMGSRERNFYNQLVRRYGYEREAAEIQDLYLSKKRDEAVAAVPDALIDEVAALGPAGFVKDRIAEMREAGVGGMLVTLLAPDHASRMAMIEELARLA